MITIHKCAIGSAPGNLDFLGGIAGFDGALVLQTQTQLNTTVLATLGAERILAISNAHSGKHVVDIDSFNRVSQSNPTPEEIRTWIESEQIPEWAKRISICLFIFCNEFDWSPENGISFAISSDIPNGIGANNNDALKIATIRSLEKLTGFYIERNRQAEIDQQIENEILERPTPAINSLTSAFGKPGCVLPIDCRLFQALPPIEMPKGISVFGWAPESNKGQSSDHTTNVHLAAQIGGYLAKDLVDQNFRHIADYTPSQYFERIEAAIPYNVSGYDTALSALPEQKLAQIDPDMEYPVKHAFSFSILENHRCLLTSHMLSSMAHNLKRKTMEHIGELMIQSHVGYRNLGFGNELFDRMARKLAKLGNEKGIFGYRLSGLDKCHSMVILAEKKALKSIRDASREIGIETGEPGTVFQ